MSAHLAPSSEMELETERKFLIEKVFGLAGAGGTGIDRTEIGSSNKIEKLSDFGRNPLVLFPLLRTA